MDDMTVIESDIEFERLASQIDDAICEVLNQNGIGRPSRVAVDFDPIYGPGIQITVELDTGYHLMLEASLAQNPERFWYTVRRFAYQIAKRVENTAKGRNR